MSEDPNQLEIPPSFVALYVAPGSTRPSIGRSEMTERYERCEDMAQLLTDIAPELQFKHKLSESEVSARVTRGLLEGEAAFPEPEAQWVGTRMCELLDWPLPDQAQ